MNERDVPRTEKDVTPEMLDVSFTLIQGMLVGPDPDPEEDGIRKKILAGAGVEKSIRTKEDKTDATAMDDWVEQKLCKELQGQFPDLPVFGEESGYNIDELQKLDAFWLLDPIDGTGAYIKGEPTFTCMATCVERNKETGKLEVTRALIYNPTKNVMFAGQKDRGVYKTTFDEAGEPIEKVQIDLRQPLPENVPKIAMCKKALIPQVSRIFESEGIVCEPAPSGGGFRYTQVLDGAIVAGFQLHGGGKLHDYTVEFLVEESGGALIPILDDEKTWKNGVSSVACRAEFEESVRAHIPELREIEHQKA